jgi:hypothetical protein
VLHSQTKDRRRKTKEDNRSSSPLSHESVCRIEHGFHSLLKRLSAAHPDPDVSGRSKHHETREAQVRQTIIESLKWVGRGDPGRVTAGAVASK